MMHRYGIVTAVKPKSRTVDLVMTDNGERVYGVQVMSSSASSDTGSWDVPSMPKPDSEKDAATLPSSSRRMIAVCAPFMGGRHLVIGWAPPLGHQMAFNEDDRAVHRHASGAYVTTAPDGSMEVYHPSGAMLRIGTGAHQDLASVSADGNWTEVTAAAEPTITLKNASCTVTILPNNGGVTIAAPGSPLTVTYQTATFNGPLTLNGKLTVNGDEVVSGNVTAGFGTVNKTLLHHVHPDRTVRPGL